MFKRNIFILGASLVVVFGFGKSVNAQTVNYQILKYGTNETSYASAYFVNPGDVSVQNGNYKVSLTVKTKHDLGRFPVQILNVDGQTPNVSKSTNGDTDFYTFSFLTKDLSNKINGNMKVDVDMINYHHNYGFNLKVDTTNLPDLNKSKSAENTNKQKEIKQDNSSNSKKQQTSENKQNTDDQTNNSQQNSVETTKATDKKDQNVNKNTDVTKETSSSQQTVDNKTSSSQQGESTSSSSVTDSSNTDQMSSTQSTSQASSDMSNSQKNSLESVKKLSNVQQKNNDKKSFLDSTWTYAGLGILSGGAIISLLSYLKKRKN